MTDIEEKMAEIAQVTKKGFDLKARLQGRGLRKATIVLYLDEELGADLGDVRDLRDGFNNVVGKHRTGIIGDLDEAMEARAVITKDFEAAKALDSKAKLDTKELDARIADLEVQRDKLVEELTRTGITIKMRAVPPVIQKDTHRLAKQTLGIDSKKIPEDKAEDFNFAVTAHLMSRIFQSVTDNETGEVNESLSYEDCIALMDLLPPGQFDRLDEKLGEVQFTDAISRSIESQEDFS